MSRRGLLAGSGLTAAAALVAAVGADAGPSAAAVAPGAVGLAGSDPGPVADTQASVPFHGPHQAGIVTPQQQFLTFAAYDLVGPDRAAFAELLRTWTAAAARLAAGQPLGGAASPFLPPPDSGEATGLGPARLTLTVGFGPSLFDGRLGLAAHRPSVLEALPPFAGDDLDPARTAGDLCIQACADDPRVAFHAVRGLTRLAEPAAVLRYVQTGAGPTTRDHSGFTPRNLLGFRDGTSNLDPGDGAAMRRFVWADRGQDRPWMAGGTYLVSRRIRIHLEAWDRSTLEEQEATIGRVKSSGAPLGGRGADEPADLGALGSDGQPLIPVAAHIRQASPSLNGGAAILRRGYSFMDGVDPASGELDAGLFFICFQKDPTRQFVPIQRRLSGNDALAQYLVHTGSGVFACPPGVSGQGAWGEGLLEAIGG